LAGVYLGAVLGDHQIVGAKIAMLEMKNGPILELVEYSYKDGPCDHTIVNFGIYHLAHFVSDMDLFLKSATRFGILPIGSIFEKIPAGPFKDKRIVFLRAESKILLEIIEK
jgi:hypothetical protein